MSDFLSLTLARVPAGFDLPEPLRLLFEWVGQQGFVVTGHDGDLYGSISRDAWVGTRVELRGFTADQTASYAAAWLAGTRSSAPRRNRRARTTRSPTRPTAIGCAGLSASG
ncbi:hypothetical protein [Actinoplanes hulinensis]|uniref:hypothetical protein n=1 Tax=Actinoplanes hulinensis TaxID=1144547 RepID=UPI001FE24CB4|nr:hypothetical protein [Actinoplanes hulinensis]